MTATTAPALFDLDDEFADDTTVVPVEPIRRPVWSTVACHACGQALKRFVLQNPDTGWYRYELDHTAWDHLRAHENGRLLLRLMPWGVGSTNAIQRVRGNA